MPTYRRIVSPIYALLVALSLIVMDMRFFLLPVACFSLILFFAGAIYFPHWRAYFAVPWPALTAEADLDTQPRTLVIEDTPCPQLGYEQELIVALCIRRIPELLATAALAAATLYQLLAKKVLTLPYLDQGWGLFGVEFIAFAGWLVLLANLRWFFEQRFLRGAYYAIGTISKRDPGLFRNGIVYQFLDHDEQRHGGYGPLWGRGRDNAVFVFYQPNDPDKNAAHGSFLFHRLKVHLIPMRNRDDRGPLRPE